MLISLVKCGKATDTKAVLGWKITGRYCEEITKSIYMGSSNDEYGLYIWNLNSHCNVNLSSLCCHLDRKTRVESV